MLRWDLATKSALRSSGMQLFLDLDCVSGVFIVSCGHIRFDYFLFLLLIAQVVVLRLLQIFHTYLRKSCFNRDFLVLV